MFVPNSTATQAQGLGNGLLLALPSNYGSIRVLALLHATIEVWTLRDISRKEILRVARTWVR